MMSTSRLLAYLALPLALIASILPAGAQEKQVPITYRITAFGPGALKSNSYSNTRAGEQNRVSKMHVTNPIETTLRDGSFLDFFAEDLGPEDPPSFSLRISSTALRGNLLVILMNTGKEMKPLLLDLKALKIQGGGQYVFNLLPVAVAVQCGEDAKPLPVAAGKTLNIPAPSEDKVIQTLYYADPNGKPKRFSSSIYFKDKETRQIVFCYGEKGAKLPKVAPISVFDVKKPAPAQ